MLCIISKSIHSITVLDTDDWVESVITKEYFAYAKSLGVEFTNGIALTPTALKFKSLGVLTEVKLDSSGYLTDLRGNVTSNFNLSDICRGFGSGAKLNLTGVWHLYVDDRFTVMNGYYLATGFLCLDLSKCSASHADYLIKAFYKDSRVFITYADSDLYIEYLIKRISILSATSAHVLSSLFDFFEEYKQAVERVRGKYVPALQKQVDMILEKLNTGEICARKVYLDPSMYDSGNNYYIEACQKNGGLLLGRITDNLILERYYFGSLSTELNTGITKVYEKLWDDA